MKTFLTMPRLGETMEEGIIAGWLIEEGSQFKRGDAIFEVETDKTIAEYPALFGGVLLKILSFAGDKVAVGDNIAEIETDEEELASDSKMESHQENENIISAEPIKPQIEEEKANVSDVSSPSQLRATPLARRFAKQNNIHIHEVTGSGRRGRIELADVKSFIASLAELSQAADKPTLPQIEQSSPLPNDLPYEDIPNSGMRKTIASRLVESKSQVPHYYVSIDCILDELLTLRKTLNAESNGGQAAFKISINDMIIKAVALALKKVPEMNVAWGGDFIRYFHQSHIAVAVATDNGLITPIIKQAEAKGLSTISTEMKDLIERAKIGDLAANEYQGGTFTLSNLGMFGVKEFQAIVNPPSAGILAIGAGEKRVIVKNGAPAIATVMTVTLSADHRASDGTIGALFIAAFKEYIENPLAMIL